MGRLAIGVLGVVAAAVGGTAAAAEFDTQVAMRDKGAATYYVAGHVAGVGELEFMVDTGSGFMTINEEALGALLREGEATYVREITGIMADGSRRTVAIYRINALNIGNDCMLRDVEAAVFPGKTRNILGLSALERAAPFIFSTNPPQLVLSNCQPDASEVASASQLR